MIKFSIIYLTKNALDFRIQLVFIRFFWFENRKAYEVTLTSGRMWLVMITWATVAQIPSSNTPDKQNATFLGR